MTSNKAIFRFLVVMTSFLFLKKPINHVLFSLALVFFFCCYCCCPCFFFLFLFDCLFVCLFYCSVKEGNCGVQIIHLGFKRERVCKASLISNQKKRGWPLGYLNVRILFFCCVGLTKYGQMMTRNFLPWVVPPFYEARRTSKKEVVPRAPRGTLKSIFF